MNNQPLADRVRPSSLDDVIGQSHLVGKNGILRRLLAAGRVPNMIFYGPPGTGKTTVANILAKASGQQLYKLNATTASLSDIKEVTGQTDNMFSAASGGTMLYLDEIQYFNRKQQQSLLEFLENGKITLIASTTENPYYYIYDAILSRSSVFEFKPISPAEVVPALRRALGVLNGDFGTDKTTTDEVLLTLAGGCGGDVRMALNVLENAYYVADDAIDKETLRPLMPGMSGNFDRNGDVHYDLLSCLQKSIRGSDPDAAVFYLARLLAGGDLISACRRLQVIASEDIGCAYPLAAVVTRACVESARELGLPEGAIPLANAAVMLATAPKSNAAHNAYFAAKEDMDAGHGRNIPEHLRSPFFRGYLYPHDYPGNWVKQQYLPDDIKDRHYYIFGNNKTEQAAKAYYDLIRRNVPSARPSADKT